MKKREKLILDLARVAANAADLMGTCECTDTHGALMDVLFTSLDMIQKVDNIKEVVGDDEMAQ